MRRLIRPLALAALGLGLAGTAHAQTLNDVGRLLQDQVLGARPNPQAERDAYERGRRDEASRRYDGRDDQGRREQDRRTYDDRRQYDQNQRQRADDAERHRRDMDRQRADQERAWADERRARAQSNRY